VKAVLPYQPMPSHAEGGICRRCFGGLWCWQPGAGYKITVCDGCLEVTLPPGAGLFDSGQDYLARAEELRAMLAGRRGTLISRPRLIAQPSEEKPHGAHMDENAAARV